MFWQLTFAYDGIESIYQCKRINIKYRVFHVISMFRTETTSGVHINSKENFYVTVDSVQQTSQDSQI